MKTLGLLFVLFSLASCVEDGAKGSDGADSVAGKIGADGPQGAGGEKGEQGEMGLQGAEGDKGLDGVSPNLDPSLSSLEKMVAGLGGQAPILALKTFEMNLRGERFISAEGLRPFDDAAKFTQLDISMRHDIENDKMRFDKSNRVDFLGGLPLSYSEIINANTGVVDGVDSAFGFPGDALPSSRWAAIRKQHLLLNPVLLAKQALANPAIVSDHGEELFNDVVHQVVRISLSPRPVDLFVNPSNGEIAKLVTVENHQLKRDVQLEVLYSGWTKVGDLRFPTREFLTLDGQLLLSVSNSDIKTDSIFPATTFDYPPGLSPVYDADLEKFGEKSHQFFMGFSEAGVAQGAIQTFIAPTELGPGVWFIGGGSHNSMVVEQSEGIVVVEAPLYPERSEALITWIKTQYPNKDITYVIATHHHADHIGGLRAFVAIGAHIVSHASNHGFLQKIFSAPSTVVPDALQVRPISPTLVPVNEALALQSSLNPIRVFSIASTHASDMVVAHIESTNALFNSDMWLPGNGGVAIFPADATILHTMAEQLGADLTLVGGHGGIGPLSELTNFVNP